MDSIVAQKRAAGEAAVDRFVRDGMCVGLGTGSTAYWAVNRVGELIAAGAQLTAIATSTATERQCRELGIPLVAFLERDIDVAIDGADEVAADRSLTKGGGGALFREKCVALAAARFVVVVDESKIVDKLGAFPTPVEVVPFALAWVRREIVSFAPHAAIALRGGAEPFATDNGNRILDCHFGTIDDPRELEAELRVIHGVVDVGIFVDLTDDIIVAGTAGIRTI